MVFCFVNVAITSMGEGMITDWLLEFVYNMWKSLVESLPDMPAIDPKSYIAKFFEVLFLVNYYLPIVDMIQFLGTVLTIYGVLIAFKIKRWRPW